jgi:hypothetical protein
MELFNNERPHEALEMKCPAGWTLTNREIYPGRLRENIGQEIT